MDIKDLEKKLVGVIVEHLQVNAVKVVPEANFIDDLGADSLDAVEMVMAFEEKFDIEIPDEDAEKITTLQEAIDLCQGENTIIVLLQKKTS